MKYPNVRIQHLGQTHVNAHCTQCEWIDQSRETAVRAANKHTKETGHVVAVEKGTVYHIHPAKTNQNKPK